MINIVKRPFKSGGVFYPVGSVVTDSTGIKLYKSKVAEGKIIMVDEHDIDNVADYFMQKMGVDIKANMKPKYDENYLAKVKAAAVKYDIVVEGRQIEDVIVDVKAAQAKAKTTKQK